MHGISANITSLLHTEKYGAINEADSTALGYYNENDVSDTFSVQEYITRYGQVINTSELLVRE